jgi:hypothetical protein
MNLACHQATRLGQHSTGDIEQSGSGFNRR